MSVSLNVNTAGIRKAIKDLEDLAKSSGDAGQGLSIVINQTANINNSTKKMGSAVRGMANEFEQLQRRLDPVKTAMTGVRHEIEVLKQGFSEGRISQQQYRDQMRQLLEQLKSLRQGMAETATASQGMNASQRALYDRLNPMQAQLTQYHENLRQLRQMLKEGSITHNQFVTSARNLTQELRNSRQNMNNYAELAQKMGISVGQLKMAMRGLPMQFNDIATSLASGMPPFMVMMQQLPQIRDQFGGWGNAMRGVGSQLKSLGKAAFTVKGAFAAALLVFAAVGASVMSLYADFHKLNGELALTGNAAVQGASEVYGVASRIAQSSSISFSAARDIVAEIASSGKFASDELEKVSTAVAKVNQAFGDNASDKLKDAFSQLANRGVSALAEVERQYHFLDEASLKQIQNLVKQKQEGKAVELAMTLLGRQATKAAEDTVEAWNPMQKMWATLKQMGNDAWRGIGLTAVAVGNTVYYNWKLFVNQIQQLWQSLMRLIKTGYINMAEGVNGLAKFLHLDFKIDTSDSENDLQALIHHLKVLAGEEEDLRKKASYGYNRDEVAKQFGGDGTNPEGQTREQMNKMQKELNDLSKKGNKEKKYSLDLGQRTLTQLEQEILALREQLSIIQESGTQLSAMSQQRKSHVALVAKIKLLETEAARRRLTDEEKSLLANKERIIALSEQKALLGDQLKEQEEINKAIEDGKRKMAEFMAEQGRGGRFRDRAVEIAGIETDPNMSDKAKAEMKRQAEARYSAEDEARLNWMAGVKASLEEYGDEWDNLYDKIGNWAADSFDSLGDALADFVTTGKMNFRDFATSVIADLSKILMKAALANAAMTAFGLGGGGMGNSFVSAIQSAFGFASGGFTGRGGKYEPAGIVHKGEYVFDAVSTREIGIAQLEAIRQKALRGYATGGAVGMPTPAITSSSSGSDFTYSPTYNITGGNNDNMERIAKLADQAAMNVIQRELSQGGRIKQAIGK